MLEVSYRALAVILLLIGSLLATFYIVGSIQRGWFLNAETLKSVIAYFPPVFLIAASVTVVTYRLCTTSERAGVLCSFAGFASLVAVLLLVGARPEGRPVLSELVDSSCHVRLTLVPYALANPAPFWKAVGYAAHRSVEESIGAIRRCNTILAETERKDCMEWVQASAQLDRYCQHHAERKWLGR